MPLIKARKSRPGAGTGAGAGAGRRLTKQQPVLRREIPCRLAVCAHDVCRRALAAGASSAVLHLRDGEGPLVVDAAAAVVYWELFYQYHQSWPALVVPQTAYRAVQQQGGRNDWRSLQDAVRDPRYNIVTFANEFHCDLADAAADDAQAATPDEARRRIVATAQWYAHHAQRPTAVLTTADEQLAYGDLPAAAGVALHTVEELVTSIFGEQAPAAILAQTLATRAETLRAGAADGLAANAHGYVPHLPEDELLTGVASGMFLRGRLHVQNCGRLAYVRDRFTQDDEVLLHQDIRIDGLAARNRAIHGDVVVIEVLPREQWASASRRMGHVVGILERRWRDCVTTIQQDDVERNGRTAYMVPLDPRFPKVRVHANNKTGYQDKRVVVRIDEWPLDRMFPEGHVIDVLGNRGDIDAEIKAILLENELAATDFTPAQLAEMPVNTPEQPWFPDPDQVAQRRDLRDSHLIFSIDPLGCEDVDDALGIRDLGNGRVEVSVHIADVSHFVRPGMLTDAEARNRCTTVYLADRRHDMLPAVLSADLCSLHDRVDRYAMSVIWELSADGQIEKQWFGRTLIRSAYKLHYELAQAIFDGSEEAAALAALPTLREVSGPAREARVAELRKAIRQLILTSRKLKAQRHAAGGLQLASDELRVSFASGSREIRGLTSKEELEIHGVVAEFMIFANAAVAERIARRFPSKALLRRHPLPEQAQFEELRAVARHLEVPLDTSSNLALAESLDAAGAIVGPARERMLRMLATQAMTEAEYFCTGAVAADQWFHYGLGLQYYTHFTSPIRRYADVIVHRQLMATLESDGSSLPTSHDVANMSALINLRNRSAKAAQQQSVDLYHALYIQQELGRSSNEHAETLEVPAVVFHVRENGALCYVADPGFRMFVPFEVPSREDGSQAPSSAAPLVEMRGGVKRVVRLEDGECWLEGPKEADRQALEPMTRVTVGLDVNNYPYRLLSLRARLLDVLGPASDSTNVAASKGTRTKKLLPREGKTRDTLTPAEGFEDSLYRALCGFQQLALHATDEVEPEEG